MYETLEQNMYLKIHIGAYSNGDMIIANRHHFPISYGNPPTLYIHGVPLYSIFIKEMEYKENSKNGKNGKNGNMSNDNKKGIYGVVKIDNGRTICTIKASVYNPNSPNHNVTIETVRHVLYPNSKVDFSFISDPNSKEYITTMYKNNDLPDETPDINIIHELLENYINATITRFIFAKEKRSKEQTFTIEKQDNIWIGYYDHTQKSTSILNAFFEEIETHNHYPPLDNNDIGMLKYVGNSLMDGYDIMKYYANRRIMKEGIQ